MTKRNDDTARDAIPTVVSGPRGRVKATALPHSPRQADRYQIERTIADGGMGEVVEADDEQIGPPSRSSE